MFQPQKKDKLNVGISVQQAAIARQLFARKRIEKGQKVFEYDTVANEIRLAEFKTITAEFPTKGKPGDITSANQGNIRRELIPKPNCIYRVAINLQNAKKKFSTYINAKNKRGTGKTYWVDCPSCESEKSVEIFLKNKEEGILTHIFPCHCGYQGESIDNFIKK